MYIPKIILILLTSFVTMSEDFEKTAADTIFYNGRIYTVDENMDIAEAMAVYDGKILATGSLATPPSRAVAAWT